MPEALSVVVKAFSDLSDVVRVAILTAVFGWISNVSAIWLTNRANSRRQTKEHAATDRRVRNEREMNWRREAFVRGVERLGQFQESMAKYVLPDAKPMPSDFDGMSAAINSVHLFASPATIESISNLVAITTRFMNSLAAKRAVYDDRRQARDIWLRVCEQQDQRIESLLEQYTSTAFEAPSHVRDLRARFIEQEIEASRSRRADAEARAAPFQVEIAQAYAGLFEEYVNLIEEYAPAGQAALIAIRSELQLPLSDTHYGQALAAQQRETSRVLREALSSLQAAASAAPFQEPE